MHRKVALILSLTPIKPIKSGMQNTIFLLQKYLKKKRILCKFVNVKNLNEIDPVVNLKFEKNTFKNIDKAIKTSKPNFIFVNTSKLLYIYKDLLLNSNKQFKTILVAHDLYHFRKNILKN